LGDGGSGKTSFLKKFMGGEFEKSYIPTLGVDVKPLNFGNVEYSVWDTAGQVD